MGRRTGYRRTQEQQTEQSDVLPINPERHIPETLEQEQETTSEEEPPASRESESTNHEPSIPQQITPPLAIGSRPKRHTRPPIRFGDFELYNIQAPRAILKSVNSQSSHTAAEEMAALDIFDEELSLDNEFTDYTTETEAAVSSIMNSPTSLFQDYCTSKPPLASAPPSSPQTADATSTSTVTTSAPASSSQPSSPSQTSNSETVDLTEASSMEADTIDLTEPVTPPAPVTAKKKRSTIRKVERTASRTFTRALPSIHAVHKYPYVHIETQSRCEAEISLAKQTRTCPHCSHEFGKSDDILRRHLWDHHICYICECGYFAPRYEGFTSHQKREHGTTSHPNRRIDRHFFAQAKVEINATLPAEFPHPPLKPRSEASTSEILTKMTQPGRKVKIISPVKSPKKPIHSRLGMKSTSSTAPTSKPVFTPSTQRLANFKKALPSTITKPPTTTSQPATRPLVVQQLKFPRKDQATSPMKLATPTQFKKSGYKQRIATHTQRLTELQRQNRDYHNRINQNNQEIQQVLQLINQDASRLVREDVEN
jgi:hypothetical protein